MGLVVGSARIDENGKISSGALGDNNGREVSTQPYYLHSKGWYVLRPKTIALANGLASAMSDACANNHIGYDQSNRYGVIKMVRKYGSMKAIKEKTEADCSSLVRGCCIQNGFDPGDFATSGEAAKLEATGKFEKRQSVSANTVLYNGDVLVTKTSGHTVIVVSGNSRSASNGQSAAPVTSKTAKSSAQKKSSAVAGTYKTSTDCHMRNGAGKQNASMVVLEQGTEVRCYGYYSEYQGVKWLYVQVTYKGVKYTGFVSERVLNKQ